MSHLSKAAVPADLRDYRQSKKMIGADALKRCFGAAIAALFTTHAESYDEKEAACRIIHLCDLVSRKFLFFAQYQKKIPVPYFQL